jgi:cysteine synthase A
LNPRRGAGCRPELLRRELVHGCVHVTDRDCVVGCRRLLRREALLVGGSSGGVLMAICAHKAEIPRDAVCVGIFLDRSERYLDTIYSDAWTSTHLGDIASLVEQDVPTAPDAARRAA